MSMKYRNQMMDLNSIKEEPTRFRLMSIERMFNAYWFENGRVHPEDAKITKARIASELHRRLEASLKLLDNAETTEADVQRIYRQFIEH